MLKLLGEKISGIDLHIGFLHRGVERLVSNMNPHDITPHFDRLDYTSVLIQAHTYAHLIIKNTSIKLNNLYYVMDEYARILNHLIAVGTHSIDLGAMGPAFWCFELRENIFEIIEYLTGSRIHAAMYGLKQLVVNNHFLIILQKSINFVYKTLTEVTLAILNNKILKQRLCFVGILTIQKNNFVTGVLLRSSGVSYDCRLDVFNNSYQYYKKTNLNILVGVFGDSYDRLIIRLYEMIQSALIITQFVKIVYNANIKNNIENIINKFKNITTFSGYASNSLESAKGVFSASLLIKAHKVHFLRIRSPSFFNLQLLPELAENLYIADLSALIGSVDVVFGEVDR